MNHTRFDFETLIEVDDRRIEAIERLVRGVGLPAEVRALVYDMQYENSYTQEAARTIGFTDDHPLLSVIDIYQFTTQIQLRGERLLASEGARKLSFWGSIEPLISDRVAREVTLALSCRAILMFDNGTTPFRLYSKGEVVKNFCDPLKVLGPEYAFQFKNETENEPDGA